MQEVALERFKYAAMQVVPKNMIVEVSDSHADYFIRDQIVMRVEQQVYGHRLAEWTAELEVPTNWWQHLKATLRLKHKTKRQVAHITRRRLYPDLPVLPEKKAGVSFLVEDSVTL